MRHASAFLLIVLSAVAVSASGQRAGQPPPTPEQAARAARQSELRGAYDRYRANNDLLHYALNVRVDPEKKFISGRNKVQFRMLSDDTRIRLDLYANLAVDKVVMGSTPLKVERELNAVFIDFPETLRKGRTYEIDFHYSGTPLETGRFGGIAFRKDPAGRHWINTACEGEGSSIWWPSKDQWRDEVEGMTLSVEIPNPLGTCPMAASWVRPTWATAIRAGIGAFTTLSIRTTSRSTSGRTSTSPRKRAT